MSTPIQSDRISRYTALIENEERTLEEIFQRMTSRVPGVEGAQGRPETLPTICASWNVPYGRVLTWLMADTKRYALYERALEVAAHEFMSEVVEIADGDQFPQNKRIRIETRFRLAEHHAREKYGRREEAPVNTLVLINADLTRVADQLLERLGGRTIEQPRLAEESTEGEI